MKNKIIAALIITMVLALTGCGGKDTNKNDNNEDKLPVEENIGGAEEDLEDSDANIEEPTDDVIVDGGDVAIGTEDETVTDSEDVDSEDTDSEDGNTSTSLDAEEQKEVDAIKEAVASAFGENYIPNMPYQTTQIDELFGVKADWYDAIIAEGPMISTFVDTFIVVHPTEGNLDKVKEALDKYKDYLVNDSMQYPMNQEKVKAATVTVIEDKVYFIMLGFVDDMIEDESERFKGFEEQNQIALDAINELIKK